jgi:hypothetical protein
MSQFLRLLSDSDKAAALSEVCSKIRNGKTDSRVFEVLPSAFEAVPGKPFAYWVSSNVRDIFKRMPSFEAEGRTARQGLATAEDFRFVRNWWEILSSGWSNFAKGGAYSPYYSDINLLVNWKDDGGEIKAGICKRYPYLNGNAEFVAKNTQFYFRKGLTWPNATTLGISIRALPSGSVFGHMGPSAFLDSGNEEDLLSLIGLMNSWAFSRLVEMQLALAAEGRKHYEVGIIQRTPVPSIEGHNKIRLATLAHRAWTLMRTCDTVVETSHVFASPVALRTRLGDYDRPAIEAELARIQLEIDAIAFSLYNFSEADRTALQIIQGAGSEDDLEESSDDEGDEEERAVPIDQTAGLLSWAVGVAFGRFDWRLVTGERPVPAELKPFDPLPSKSPCMLLDGGVAFHAHDGILVDDQGHLHDLTRLVEEVLNRVDVNVPDDVCRWLRKDFFAFHLQRYSKSRRKAPVYWPLSTVSGSYTLWVYYPSLNNQTLFTAVNDFLDGPNGKLTQISRECAELRMNGSSRSRDEEKQYETMQAFEQELTDLRDTLLKIAPTYQPNHDDGVQITAAPLWPLFRHKPWQKVLKDTWTKLEKGDYDWAHLALAYWPDRVREKCKTDKSLAIAHGLEDLYVEPEAVPKKMRSKKKAGANE